MHDNEYFGYDFNYNEDLWIDNDYDDSDYDSQEEEYHYLGYNNNYQNIWDELEAGYLELLDRVTNRDRQNNTNRADQMEPPED